MQTDVKAEAIEEDEGLTGAGGAAWEPVVRVCVCVYVCMYVCMFLCVTHAHTLTNIHTHTHTQEASADDVYKEAIAWLQASGRKCYEPALRRMKRMGLSTLEYRPRPAYRPPPML